MPFPLTSSCSSLPFSAPLTTPHLLPSLQAQQALTVALNKLGELHHLQGDLPAAAKLYARALALRRALLAATRRQWGSGGDGGGQEGAAREGRRAAEELEGEGQEACCSAALDLAASCLKLSGARRALGDEAEAEVSALHEAC